MNRRSLVLLISALLLAAFAIAAFLYPRTPPAQPVPQSQDPRILVRFHSPTFGPASAPVTIVEFFDPSCEACRAFYPHLKQILAERPEDVRLVLRYALFHPGSEQAARLLEAARKQGLYAQVLEAVLAAQPAWHDDAKAGKALEAAAAVGLNLERARVDMHSPEVDAVLSADMQDVKAVGIQGTPTFFVNGQPLSEFSLEALQQRVYREAAKARP